MATRQLSFSGLKTERCAKQDWTPPRSTGVVLAMRETLNDSGEETMHRRNPHPAQRSTIVYRSA